MTIRKLLPVLTPGLTLSCLVLTLTGCATPGPNHLYVAGPERPEIISDHAAAGIVTMDVPSFLQPRESLLGVAYDSFTDHLFLRLAPGNAFRVVDRPDRSIKREFTAPEVPATGGGDIAIRSRDRHLFLGHPTNPVIIEITLHGKFVRAIPLADTTMPVAGLAYDQVRNVFHVLPGDDPNALITYDLNGRRLGRIVLARDVFPGTLAFDSDAREFYVQLRPDCRLGVFDGQGRLQRILDQPRPTAPASFDVGPRSFLRLF
ncbi:MAG: hypothetical protein K9M98_06055 [Cephaloticoccus sp.]|nr:hypothetical protein [Cephaloticoccus sp.]MCF7760048.1 hypothetical protein [Cephaloticoccus sp.]